MDARFTEVIKQAGKSKKILVVSHVNPEGDAIGSLLGAALALRSIEKDVTAYLEDPVPETFMFLPGADTVVHKLDPNEVFDATFAVDCGQKNRLGDGFMALHAPGVIINIDHHVSNDRFGDINVIAPDASAAGEVIYDFCKAAGIPITRDIAVNLYVAIHTDTGSFRYSCSTPEAFAKAGELVRLGADPWDVSTRVYENYPQQKYVLLGMVLSTLEVFAVPGCAGNCRVATLMVTLDMLKKANAQKDLADGFVNYARGIEGVAVGALFRETAPGEYKVSLRSKGSVDVASVSLTFGGGGHSHAAGFNVKCGIAELKEKVITALKCEMARTVSNESMPKKAVDM